MNFLTYRKLVVKVVIIKLSSESKPSVVHDLDRMRIVVIASYIVSLKQDISCLCRFVKCNIKLESIACRQLVERSLNIALTAV